MSYFRRTYETPVGKYVEEFHSRRNYPQGEKRGKREKPTAEEAEKSNQRRREKNATLLLMNNFRRGDYFATLTYEKRPEDMETVKADLKKLLRFLRREYKKKDRELLWICNVERGPKGGWHIHLALNRIEGTDLLLQKAWDKGHVNATLMYEEGGFRKLGEYLSKQADRGEGGKRESWFSRSRNLAMPKMEKKEIRRWVTWKDKIREPKGYILDKESVIEDNTKDGYPYRRYILLPAERRKDDDSKPVRGRVKRRARKDDKGDSLRVRGPDKGQRPGDGKRNRQGDGDI